MIEIAVVEIATHSDLRTCDCLLTTLFPNTHRQNIERMAAVGVSRATNGRHHPGDDVDEPQGEKVALKLDHSCTET